MKDLAMTYLSVFFEEYFESCLRVLGTQRGIHVSKDILYLLTVRLKLLSSSGFLQFLLS